LDPGANDADWDSLLAESGWLGHVRLILEAGIFTAQALHLKGASVLVHCRWVRVCSVRM
jgi:hypothetical protein